jgi:hypothetical protein
VIISSKMTRAPCACASSTTRLQEVGLGSLDESRFEHHRGDILPREQYASRGPQVVVAEGPEQSGQVSRHARRVVVARDRPVVPAVVLVPADGDDLAAGGDPRDPDRRGAGLAAGLHEPHLLRAGNRVDQALGDVGLELRGQRQQRAAVPDRAIDGGITTGCPCPSVTAQFPLNQST